MAQGKSRDPRKEQQWRRWIQQWQHSGLSVRAFCARHDLAEPSFYAWRRQLQQRGTERQNRASCECLKRARWKVALWTCPSSSLWPRLSQAVSFLVWFLPGSMDWR